MKTFVSFLNHLCRVYTVTALALLLLNMAISGGAENTVIRPEGFLLVLPFAAGFALVNVVYAIRSLAHWARLTLHCAVVVLCAYLFLYLPSGTGADTGMRFLMAILILLVYWLGMGVYLALSSVKSKHQSATAPYTSVYKK